MLPSCTIRNVGRVVRRIYMLILGLEGLKCKERNRCHPRLIGQSQAIFTAKRVTLFCSFANQNWYFVGNSNYWLPCNIFFTIFCGFKVIIGSSEHSSNPAQQLLHCVFVCVFHVDRGALAPLYSQSLTFFGWLWWRYFWQFCLMAHFLTIILMLTLNKLSLTCNRLYKRTEVRKRSMRVKNVNKHLFESVSTIKSWGVNLHFNTYTKSWFWLCEEVLKVIYAHLLTALFLGGGVASFN